MSIHGGVIIIRGHLSVNTWGYHYNQGHLSVNTRGYRYKQGTSKCQYMGVSL